MRDVPEPADDTERLARLRLSRTQHVGPVNFRQLLLRYGSAAAALEALPELARRGGRDRPLRIAAPAEAAAEVERVHAAGCRMIHLGEPDYPQPLAEIAAAPPTITVRGEARLLHEPAVAVVGSRNASTNGRNFARALAGELAAAGHIVVSGLARGIDAAAHEGALGAASSGGTCAVVAGGVDIVFPRENEALHRRVAEAGIVVSEMPMGLEPMARHFPRRNRIISGLSLGVVVVEAAMRSGSLITARLAAEQGREVCAVPGWPQDPRARGTNDLIRNGAVLVESAADVLEALGGGRVSRPAPPAQVPVAVHDIGPEGRAAIERRLGASPVSIDALARDCGASVADLWPTLLELELAGRLERLPGNRVALVAPAASA